MKIRAGRIIFTLTTLFLIFMSFGFSSQTGSSSTRLSKGIIAKTVETEFFDDVSYKEKAQTVRDSDLYTRKAAHFTEFALLGVSLYFFFRAWTLEKNKKPYMMAMLACLVCAAADETHQIFTAGRSPAVLDVLIDFSGCAAACLVIFLIQRMIRKLRKQKQKNNTRHL